MYSIYDVESEESVAAFDYKKDANEFLKNNDGDFWIHKEVYPDPISHVFHSVNLQIEAIMEATNASSMQIYLTGEGNFREKVAVTLPYKGNRDTSHKPTYYNEIKDFLVNRWGAKVVDGIEADDALGIEQMKFMHVNNPRSIICSIDKDLDMIPGWHYNFAKQERYFITNKEAWKNYYVQLLTGDSTDNIPGLKGVGPAKAKKVLGEADTPDLMQEIVERTYQEEYGDSWKERLDEVHKLIWILREPYEAEVQVETGECGC